MKAIVYENMVHRMCSAILKEVAKPNHKDNEVLIKVHASPSPQPIGACANQILLLLGFSTVSPTQKVQYLRV